ncbi:MAG: hypothetical protein V3U72_01890 [Candidatus Aenigmarchaeota archaeon]
MDISEIAKYVATTVITGTGLYGCYYLMIGQDYRRGRKELKQPFEKLGVDFKDVKWGVKVGGINSLYPEDYGRHHISGEPCNLEVGERVDKARESLPHEEFVKKLFSNLSREKRLNLIKHRKWDKYKDLRIFKAEAISSVY